MFIGAPARRIISATLAFVALVVGSVWASCGHSSIEPLPTAQPSPLGKTSVQSTVPAAVPVVSEAEARAPIESTDTAPTATPASAAVPSPTTPSSQGPSTSTDSPAASPATCSSAATCPAIRADYELTTATSTLSASGGTSIILTITSFDRTSLTSATPPLSTRHTYLFIDPATLPAGAVVTPPLTTPHLTKAATITLPPLSASSGNLTLTVRDYDLCVLSLTPTVCNQAAPQAQFDTVFPDVAWAVSSPTPASLPVVVAPVITPVANITIVGAASARCVDTNQGQIFPNVKAWLFDCNANQNQVWNYTTTGQLEVGATPTACLSLGGAPVQGAQVITANCATNSLQWVLDSSGAPGPIRLGDFCLDTLGEQTGKRTLLVLNHCNASSEQSWSLKQPTQ